MKLSAEVSIDNITKDISRLFDYGFDGVSTTEIPDMPKVPENFRLGLIVGPSGSGKSTLMRQTGLMGAWGKPCGNLSVTWASVSWKERSRHEPAP